MKPKESDAEKLQRLRIQLAGMSAFAVKAAEAKQPGFSEAWYRLLHAEAELLVRVV